MTFAKQLKNIRKEKSMTQVDACKKLNCSLSTIRGWEQGKWKPKPYSEQRIIETLTG